jgi:hypothetical protein
MNQWKKFLKNLTMDHIKHNYYRSSGKGSDFTVEFDAFPKKFLNHNLESKIAAQEIYDKKQGKLNILYSGGLDSEFALTTFIDLGLKVEPVFVKLNPNYNDVDFHYATEYCKNRNIPLTVIDIDFDSFVKSGKILKIAEEMECSIYHRSALAYAITKIDGTIICGDCEPYLKKYEHDWYLDIDEHEFSLGKYFKKYNIYGTPYFGCYTPEKFISYLHTDIVQDLIANRVPGKLSSFSSKSLIYNSNSSYNLSHRQKLTGYEEMEKMPIFKNEVFAEFQKLKRLYGGSQRYEISQFLKEHVNK